MNKVVSYLGGGVYAESVPERDMVKLYTDNGAAQTNIIWLEPEVIAALKKFLRDIEEECE